MEPARQSPPVKARLPRPEARTDALSSAGHAALLKKAKQGRIDLYFTGDSITRRWQASDSTHQHNWNANFFGWNAANFGWGGDTTRNVLYRLLNGELDGVHPKVIVLLVGTNDVGSAVSKDQDALVEEIAQGIRAIVDVFQDKAPEARVIVTGIFPRNDAKEDPMGVNQAIDAINARISTLSNGDTIRYLNVNGKLADAQGRLFEGMTEDGLHLSDAGYQVWADGLRPILLDWLGPPAEVDLAPAATGTPLLSDT